MRLIAIKTRAIKGGSEWGLSNQDTGAIVARGLNVKTAAELAARWNRAERMKAPPERPTDPERCARITIEAPQGWGKTWLAERILEEVTAWKGCPGIIRDADGDPEDPIDAEMHGVIVAVKDS